MRVTFQAKDRVGVATVNGALTFVGGADSFREQFIAWWQGAPEISNVVLNLTMVDILDSSGLSALISLLKCVSGRGGDVKIVGLQKKVRMVFEIMRVYKVFDVFDTEDEAIHACNGALRA